MVGYIRCLEGIFWRAAPVFSRLVRCVCVYINTYIYIHFHDLHYLVMFDVGENTRI